MADATVAITGLGVVCALGTDRETVAQSARGATRPFAPVRAFDASDFRVNLAAEVPEIDAAARFGRRIVRSTSRTDRLALWAADDALTQARLDEAVRRDAAIYVGASTGGMAEMEAAHVRGGPVPLGTYWSYPVWSTARCLSDVTGLAGPRATFMTACSSAAHALGIAMQRVRRGEHRVALVGGAEAIARLTLSGFGSLGVLDPEGTRPFDAERKGITLGEGAAFFVLESLDAARARGAPVLAVLAGYGASADAHHMVHPRDDGAGARAAIEAALADAQLSVTDVDYVNAHGTGTVQNDAMELEALRAIATARDPMAPLMVSSSKSMLGHTLGAAGAIEGAMVVLGMMHGFVPPQRRRIGADGRSRRTFAGAHGARGGPAGCPVHLLCIWREQRRPRLRPPRPRAFGTAHAAVPARGGHRRRRVLPSGICDLFGGHRPSPRRPGR